MYCQLKYIDNLVYSLLSVLHCVRTLKDYTFVSFSSKSWEHLHLYKTLIMQGIRTVKNKILRSVSPFVSLGV